MDEKDFEGTLVLEKLAEKSLLDDFYAAIDSDDVSKALNLMRRAKIDPETIAIVLQKMQDSDREP